MPHEGRLKRVPLYEQAYRAVRAMILSGELRSGQALSEGLIAERLGVSRTPVREAFKGLVSEGLLTSSPNGNVTVFSPSLEDIAEVYVARALLEGFAARLFTVAADRELLERITGLAASFQDAVRAADFESSLVLNREFHETIIAGSQNSRIVHLMDSLDPVIQRYSRISLTVAEHGGASAHEHLEVVTALASGDPDRAEAITRQHILSAGARSIQTLERLEGTKLDSSSPTAVLMKPFRHGARDEANERTRSADP